MLLVYTGSVTVNEDRRRSFTSLLELLAVSEDIGECVRPTTTLLQNGGQRTSNYVGPPPKLGPPLLIPLEDGDADAENEDEDDELGRPTAMFETNLGGGVTLQRISAKTNKSEGGKVSAI